MPHQYIKYSIQVKSQHHKDILVALLSEWGVEGFEEEEEWLHASGKTEEIKDLQIEEHLIKNAFPYSRVFVKEENWNAVWESNFQPVQVGYFAGIRAHFHAPFSNVQHEIIITPKMSFGTGHHATTFMMMQLMEHLPFNNAVVFDFGTGTGILAILAEKLGAKHVVAVDNDDWCIENAGENIASNNCNNTDLQKATKPPIEGEYGIVLANINKNIIKDNMEELVARTANDGYLLLSGLLAEDEPEIKAIATEYHLVIKEKLEKNNWIALLFKKN